MEGKGGTGGTGRGLGPRKAGNDGIQLSEYGTFGKEESTEADDLGVRAEDEGGVDRG